MITRISRVLAALALMTATAVSAVPLAGAATTSAPVTGSGTISPSAVSSIKGFDQVRTDDDIVQLSGLKVESVAYVATQSERPLLPGDPYALVTATADYGISCRAYATAESATSVPCPMPALKQYQVLVSSRTLVMGNNRATIGLDQVVAGDRINVYGFLDRDGQFVDALIPGS